MTPSTDPSPTSSSPPSGSRRRFVGFAAALGAVVAALPGRSVAAQTEAADDLALLTFLLSIEYLEVALMEDALLEFTDAEWNEAGADRAVRLDLAEIRDQEQAHVAALTGAIADAGGVPVEPVGYDVGYADAAGFLRVAAGIAETVVAAYAGAIPLLSDSAAATTVIGIHSVEGRHAGFLKLYAAESPFPDPIDQPLTRDEVLANLAGHTETDAPTATVSGGESIEPVDPMADAPNVFAAAIADAADRLGIAPDEIEIVEATERQWPTSALGCPEPDGFYAQVVTPGYRVILDAAGTLLEYHTDTSDTFVLCG